MTIPARHNGRAQIVTLIASFPLDHSPNQFLLYFSVLSNLEQLCVTL